MKINEFLFLFGCIPTRLFLGYLISISNNFYKIILGLICFIIGMGFLIIYTFNLRKTGLETLGKPIWWNNLRPLHGIIYLIVGISLIINLTKNNNLESNLIYLDTFIGLIAFLIFHNFI